MISDLKLGQSLVITADAKSQFEAYKKKHPGTKKTIKDFETSKPKTKQKFGSDAYSSKPKKSIDNKNISKIPKQVIQDNSNIVLPDNYEDAKSMTYKKTKEWNDSKYSEYNIAKKELAEKYKIDPFDVHPGSKNITEEESNTLKSLMKIDEVNRKNAVTNLLENLKKKFPHESHMDKVRKLRPDE